MDPVEEKQKWDFLRAVPIHDASDPRVQGIANYLMAVASLTPFREWCFAQLALALVRDCIRYQLDTDRVGREQIDGYTDPWGSGIAALTRGVDDCDAKARLFVALCLAAGIDAKMVPRWKGARLAHVWARVKVQGPGELEPQWRDAETILRRARLGDVAESVPREIETGRWLF